MKNIAILPRRTVITGFRYVSLAVALACSGAAAWAEAGREAPVPVHQVAPDYPVLQKRAGVCGVATISFLVDEHGAVRGVKVLDTTDEAFAQPALDAVAQWKFKPAERDGVAVAARVTLPMVFTLEGEDEVLIAKYVAASLSKAGADSALPRQERKSQTTE